MDYKRKYLKVLIWFYWTLYTKSVTEYNYLGTQYEITWSDYNDPKGFMY